MLSENGIKQFDWLYLVEIIRILRTHISKKTLKDFILFIITNNSCHNQVKVILIPKSPIFFVIIL